MVKRHISENRHLFGLTTAQVEASRAEFGLNILTPPPRDPWWKQFLSKFDDPVIRILIIAALLATFVGIVSGDYIEGIGIIIAILLATTLAFLNEYKANKEFDILNQVSDEVLVKVIREGTFVTVPRKDLVKGDLVLIETGDEIPADGILIEAVGLQIDESKLTGESMPVTKRQSTDAAAFETAANTDEKSGSPLVNDSHSCDAYPPDVVMRSSMVFDGHGIIKLTAVGDSTEIGKTARFASEESKTETPLKIQLEKLSKLIGVVGFSVAFLTFSALIGRELFWGKDLQLSSSQWAFSIIASLSVFIGLTKVWLPVFYDALELAGRSLKPPAFLESEGIRAWLESFAAGLFSFAILILFAIIMRIVPALPEEWISELAIMELLKYFMIAVTIIVVAVPEGLAMSVTLSLAYSMRRMTAANNLVRRMHACETIGAATVICSDKTGTLTQNKMLVASSHFPFHEKLDTTLSQATPESKLLALSIAANSTANLSRKPGNPPAPIGNPTEGALLLWLDQNAIDYQPIRESFEIKKQWTFSTERKFMATLGSTPDSQDIYLLIKGAPEILLEGVTQVMLSDSVKPLDSSLRNSIMNDLRDRQTRGMRTIGFAYSQNHEISESAEAETLLRDITWLGFIAIADPIRPEVPQALEICRKAGVEVKVVTGDNAATAMEIAQQIGLIGTDECEGIHLTGGEFRELSEAEARKAVKRLKILSRAKPTDKMRLVKLLQMNQEVVAVTGDGTNDAPALNHANVGLAMGKTGTSVAKEASDIILLDDSFPSVVNGIMWGRSLYDNIQRFVLFQLTINVVALGIALSGPFIGVKFPLTVVQMLWVNLIMDTFAALALATEPPHWRVMLRMPRKPGDFLINKSMSRQISIIGGIFFVSLLSLLVYFQSDGLLSPWEESVFFTVFVMLQFWNIFNARCLGLNQSAFSNLHLNRGFVVIVPAILIIQIFIVQFGRNMFRTFPLSLREWLLIIILTSPVLLIGELIRLREARKKPSDKSDDLCPFAANGPVVP